MSGSVRLAICATLATVAAGCALLPLVDASGWLFQALLLLAVQSAVGVAARRVPLARPLTVAAQALTSLVLLTLVFAQGQALGGLLPSPQALQEFALLLRSGADDVGRYAIPAPLTDGIRLLLIGGVLVIGLVVDALAVTYRSAAPAGLPLLALYSVAAGLSDDSGDWLWFLVAAAGYLVLLLAEGRDRLSQWGRVFSGGARHPGGAPPSGLAGAGGGQALAPVRNGRRIGVLALGIALAVPAALPSLDGGLLDEKNGGSGSGSSGGTISAVNPLVSLQDSLNQPENKEVLRYRTSSQTTQDLYLRIVALDKFDGTSWKSSERHVTDVPDQMPSPAGLGPSVRVSSVDTTITAADWYAQNWLPLPYPATKVEIDGRWRYEPEGRTLVGDRGQTTRGEQYRVSSLLVEPTAEQLAGAPAPPKRLLREYTQVPDSLPPVVSRTARQITKGADNAYKKAVKLQDWFAVNGGFRYDTQVQSGSGSAAIVRFLKQKEGFCVHFSFSMAAMARTLGIPARVAVGFTPGTTQADGSVSVGLKDAHAWPELYFEGVGWTRFEPTPSRGTQPDYTMEQTPTGEPSDEPSDEPSASSEPSAAPTASDTCPPQMKKEGSCDGPAAQVPDSGSSGGGWSASKVTGWSALAVLLVVVPLLPMVWRRRVRSRRLGGSAGRTDQDAADRTLAAWRELVDSAWDFGVVPDDSQTSRNTVARIVRIAGLEDGTDEAAEAARRVATAVEQVLYAPRPHPSAGIADDVRQVLAGLRSRATRWERLRALLLPRSAARLVWAAADRRSALLNRWTTPRWVTRLRNQRG
ncbi:transglutaminaseTgpA domain-containing protein [Streptomyces sp. NPDC048636]|uniref:transglutaminaseTgpA domain-containing protein n=1 Tax=Streptomyces sp. NPDC048636 TaxID=3155762 RepID=UPI00342096BD